MNKKLQHITTFLILLCAGLSYSQHDAAYNQYMFNGLILNPAYAGSNGALDATLAYKNQWTGFSGAPKTAALALHSPLKNKSSNVGLLLVDDRYGLTNKNRLQGSYAYRMRLGQTTFLSLGLQAGFESLRNNYNKLVIIDAADKSFAYLTPNSTYFISGAGLYLHSKKFFSGLSMPVMYNSNLNGLHSYKPVFAYGGYKFSPSKNFSLQPSLLVKCLKGSPTQLDVNLLLSYIEKAGLGLSYRTNKTIVSSFFCKLNEQLFLGYSYERNIGNTFMLPKNSHELVLKYTFGYSRNLKNPVTFY